MASEEKPWVLTLGWNRLPRGGYAGVLRRKPKSGGRPVTERWRCAHIHETTLEAMTCAYIEKDTRWRAEKSAP
jgi:hypothetical protein